MLAVQWRGGLMHLRGNAPPAYFVAHPGELVERPFLNGAFAFIMDNNRALFGLFAGVAANFDQRIDHPIEGIHVVIVDYQLFNVRIYGFFQNFQLCICERLHNNQISV